MVRDIGETYGHQQLLSGMALSELDVRQQAGHGRAWQGQCMAWITCLSELSEPWDADFINWYDKLLVPSGKLT